MVTIKSYKKVSVPETGKDFYLLELEGDLELVRSSMTGNLYATAKTATITSTFDEAGCKKLLGKELPGKIAKIACKPYDYTIKDTGEIISLEHTFKYIADSTNVEEEVFMEMA